MLLYPVFSTTDIMKQFPDFDRKNLVNWQKKGYIKKIRNNYYCLTENTIDEQFLNFTANKIYSPSYISLETALSYYTIIPEGVFTINSVSSIRTNRFNTPIGTFNYQHLKSSLFFGYQLIPFNKLFYKIAELEKTILDYLYLHPTIDNSEDFNHLRWNKEALKKIDLNLFSQYQSLFNSRALDKRVSYFIIFLNA